MIKSYQDNFSSYLGAYVYLALNQNFPQLFSLSSDDNKQSAYAASYQALEKILCVENNLDDIISKIKELGSTIFFDTYLTTETQTNVFKTLENIRYIQIDGWNSVQSLLDYNDFSHFIKDKEPLIQQLKKIKKDYCLKSISLNSQAKPDKFIQEFAQGVESMSDALDIKPRQIGLHKLEINFANEEGNFTGYVHNSPGTTDYQNKTHLVIKKLSVFAHEWLHFIESTMGNKNYSYTELIDKMDTATINSIFPQYKEINQFKNVISQEVNSSSLKSFAEAIAHTAHFFHRYALNKDTFHNDVLHIAQGFNGENSSLIGSIKKLLNDNYPERYFCFIEAQCEISKNKKISTNQIYDFSRKADEFLKEQNYTSSIKELFARSFETFIHSKVPPNSCSLVHHSYDSDMYPQGVMRDITNQHWEKMWIPIKKYIDNQVPVVHQDILLRIERLRKNNTVSNSLDLK